MVMKALIGFPESNYRYLNALDEASFMIGSVKYVKYMGIIMHILCTYNFLSTYNFLHVKMDLCIIFMKILFEMIMKKGFSMVLGKTKCRVALKGEYILQ